MAQAVLVPPGHVTPSTQASLLKSSSISIGWGGRINNLVCWIELSL